MTREYRIRCTTDGNGTWYQLECRNINSPDNKEGWYTPDNKEGWYNYSDKTSSIKSEIKHEYQYALQADNPKITYEYLK